MACMELHTFSSLNKEFLKEYRNTMDSADTAIIYFNPKEIKHKKIEIITKEHIYLAFNRDDIIIFDNSKKLEMYLKMQNWKNKNLLMMSSGEFDGIKYYNLIRDAT